MSVRVVARLVMAGVVLSAAASAIVRGQTPPGDAGQAPRPFDKLRVAPSGVEGREGTGQAARQSSRQAIPDFSGRWILEEVDQPDAPRGFRPGEGYGPPDDDRFGGRPPDEEVDDPARRRAMPPMEKGAIITLTQSETELVMKFGSHERAYTLSTPEGTAAQPGKTKRGDEPRKRKSRTYWDGKSLITEIEESFETPDNETVTVSSREVRTLSDGAKRMRVETTLKTDRRTHTVTQTFRRRQ